MPPGNSRGRKDSRKLTSSKPSARPPSPPRQSNYAPYKREMPSPAQQLRAHIAVSNFQKEDIDNQLFPPVRPAHSSPSRPRQIKSVAPADPPSSPISTPIKNTQPAADSALLFSSPVTSPCGADGSQQKSSVKNDRLLPSSIQPEPQDGGGLCSVGSMAVGSDEAEPDDGGGLRSVGSMAVGNDETDDGGGGALCSVGSMAAGKDDEDENAPSLTSVQRGGNRRSVPATKAQLQAAFEAACAGQNAETDGIAAGDGDTNEDSPSGIGDSGDDGDDDAPSFAGVGRGGTFRMDKSARKVPEPVKALEFDGSPGQSSDQDEHNAVGRLSSMCSTLDTGSARDKEKAMFHLQEVLPEITEGQIDLSKIVDAICDRVSLWDRNLQITSAETLQKIVALPVSEHLSKQICSLAFNLLRERAECLFYEAWGDVLVRTVPLIQWRVAQVRNYFDILDHKTGEETLVAKRLVARLIGFFALGLDEYSVKTLILPRALALAAERDVDIRGMIAESIPNIGSRLNITVLERQLWPCVRSLMKDPDTRVRAAVIRSVADLAMNLREHYPNSQLFTKLLTTMFLRCCKEARELGSQDLRFVTDFEYLNLEIKALSFGKLLVAVFDHLDKSIERKEVLKAYMTMATCNSPVVRRHCAYYLPGVASVFNTRYRSEVCALVAFFVKDNDAETRWKLAAGLHETVRLLAGRDTVDALYKAACTLLADPNPLVRLNVVRHFHETISELAKQSGYASASSLAPLFDNIHQKCHGNWRAQELLATQLRHTARLVPPPTIASNVLPALFKIAAGTTWLVRKEIMQGVTACLRYMSDTAVREVAMEEFKKTWARATKYWKRLSFVYAAEAARLRLASVLEIFAPAVHTMEEFESAVKSLKQDEDPDVQMAMVDFDVRMKLFLEESAGKFEQDLDLEEEEQAMYSRHLKAQRNVAKKYHLKPVSPKKMIPSESPSCANIIEEVSTVPGEGGDEKGETSISTSSDGTKAKDDLDIENRSPDLATPKRSASSGLVNAKDKSEKMIRQILRIPNKSRSSQGTNIPPSP